MQNEKKPDHANMANRNIDKSSIIQINSNLQALLK